jgi:hypothetical protein
MLAGVDLGGESAEVPALLLRPVRLTHVVVVGSRCIHLHSLWARQSWAPTPDSGVCALTN